MAGAGPLSAKEVAAARRLRRALRARVAERAGGRRLPRLPRGQRHLRALARAGDGAGRRGQPVYIPPAWNMPAAMWSDEPKALDAFRTGRGVAWGEHDAAHGLRRGRVLPQRLPREPGAAMAAGARRRGGAARGRHRGGRRRLRPRPLDAADGAGVSELALLRLRHACRVDRRGAAQCGARPASRSASSSRSRARRTTPTSATG